MSRHDGRGARGPRGREAYEKLRDAYVFEERGLIDIKGKGGMSTYLLLGRKGEPPETFCRGASA